MSIQFRNHPDYPESILIRDLIGDVGVTEIIDSWENLIAGNFLKPGIRGVMNDLTECNLQLSSTSFTTLTDYLKSKAVFRGLKLAVICDCLKNIVFPTMGENFVSELKIRPFSTLQAAVNWILED